jgi:hypothetical protein
VTPRIRIRSGRGGVPWGGRKCGYPGYGEGDVGGVSWSLRVCRTGDSVGNGGSIEQEERVKLFVDKFDLLAHDGPSEHRVDCRPDSRVDAGCGCPIGCGLLLGSAGRLIRWLDGFGCGRLAYVVSADKAPEGGSNPGGRSRKKVNSGQGWLVGGRGRDMEEWGLSGWSGWPGGQLLCGRVEFGVAADPKV